MVIPALQYKNAHVLIFQVSMLSTLLQREFHPTRNIELRVQDVRRSSNKKIWWLCSRMPTCGVCQTVHEWQTTPNKRTYRSQGCPYCISGNSDCICKCNTVAFCYPELAKEISPLANINPWKIAAQTHQKVLWLCPNVPDGVCPECKTLHSWSAMVSNRVKGRGCPFCSNVGKEICKCKSLAWRHPELCTELVQDGHDPWKLKTGSNQQVKWQCSAFPGGKCTTCNTLHEWEASIANRVKGNGCPFCTTRGGYVCRCRSFGWTHPDLAKELVDVDPFQISTMSAVKCKWRCSKVDGGVCPECQTPHIWEAIVNSRARGVGCPWCSNRGNVLCKCKSLGWRFPDIAKDLLDVDPAQISYGSEQVCTWKCSNGKDHTYNATPNNRTNVGSGCPICRANKGEAILRDLLDNHPDVESHHKKALECFDKYTNRTRMLVPDACIRLMSGALVAIELDGPQHFGPVTWYGEPTDFVDQMRRDIAKNTTLQHLGYSILRIAYSEYNQIPFRVNDFISDVLRSDRPVMQRTPEETYQALERLIENLL
jgi:hypothetical protein